MAGDQTTDDRRHQLAAAALIVFITPTEHPTAQRIRTDGGETQRRGCNTRKKLNAHSLFNEMGTAPKL
jgi:hypothetical protein